MKNKAKLFFTSNNMVIVYLILLFSIAVTICDQSFLTPATVINLGRSSVFSLCFVLCEMLCMIGGGIDVSFPAIGCVSMYVPMYLYSNGIIGDNAIVFILVALLCGLIFGLLNGLLIAVLKIPPLIATLATSSIASGGLSFIFGVRDLTKLPSQINALSKMNLLVYVDPSTGINYPLTVLILVPIILCIIVSIVLRFTMLGRGIFAVGGNLEAARTVGFPTKRIIFFTYTISAIITSIAAVLYVTLMHTATTTAFMGNEMIVIAACIIGGCSLSGGRGTVLGCVIGTVLVTLVQNHLNMLGIETRWQTLAVGIVLLIGVLMTALRNKYKKKLYREVAT